MAQPHNLLNRGPHGCLQQRACMEMDPKSISLGCMAVFADESHEWMCRNG